MGTPTYKGAGQPVADNGGFLGGLGSWFGGSTPGYAGKGQPSSTSSGSGPAYKAAPPKPATAAVDAAAPRVTLIDGQPLDADSIAIVIPRELAMRLAPQKMIEESEQ